jgi:hypothetical protein
MTSAGPVLKSLVSLGSMLVVLNVIVNVLDLTTTFIGFARGMPEQNRFPSFFMHLVGSDFAGAILLKLLYFVFFIMAFYSIREVQHRYSPERAAVLVALLDAFLFFAAYEILITVLGNLTALGYIT